jgi:serine/threonine-protein kinase
MIGRFGEVYLVDWGIAVSLEADPTGRLPRVDDARDAAGTPCYMAPEMLGMPGGPPLGPHSDVYLLGAILHEILTGEPPHRGNFRQIVASILRSSFVYDSDVSVELAEIARRAMHPVAAERFQTADEFRQRLEWYLRHRGSLALSAEATERLEELRGILARGVLDGTQRDRAYRAFTECRFGFRQALRASNDNTTAERGIEAAILTMAEYELAHGTPEAAAAVLAELEAPEPGIAARVAEAVRVRAEEQRRLRTIAADNDPSIGRRTRAFVALVLGLVWTVAPQIAHQLDKKYPVTPTWSMYGWSLSLGVATLLLGRWGAESLSKTTMNRHTRAASLIVFSSQFVLELGATKLGIAFSAIVGLHFFLWFVVAWMFAALADRRLWVMAVGYFLAFFAVCFWPAQRWHFASAANLVLTINLVMVWGSRGDARSLYQRLARGERAETAEPGAR